MDNTEKETIHIVGIGGIGMSAIAEILYNFKYPVQGSDIKLNDCIDRLHKLGIKIYIGHDANHIKHAHVLLHSSAIKFNNVELVAARNNNKAIIHRSDMLARITENKYVISVSGSSGKTTTIAMIASIFDQSSIDATVIVGGILNSYRSNLKIGRSNIFLVEADESDETMLKVHSDIAVITSINSDHIDHYRTFSNIKNAFSEFARKADSVILPNFTDVDYNGNNFTTSKSEDDIRSSIAKSSPIIPMSPMVIPTFNTHVKKKESSLHFIRERNIKATNIRQYSNSIKFDMLINGNQRLNNILLSNAIGTHKVVNALAAVSVALKLGVSYVDIRDGLWKFKGVARRFSLIADIKGVKLIEDYAHHPNEILATLTAARLITKGKVIGIIELLRFTRIRSFFDEFIQVFMMFDYVILTQVHPPYDEPILGYKIGDIKEALVRNCFYRVKAMSNALLISYFISNSTNSGDVVLFIGAGDNIAKIAKEAVKFMSSN